MNPPLNDTATGQLRAHVAGRATSSRLELRTGGAGLLLGFNRRNNPVTAHLFRPEPTRAVLVGGLPCVRLLAYRALALGARVTVQTVRAGAWAQIAEEGAGGVAVVRPGPLRIQPGTATCPQLLILDVSHHPEPEGARAGWQATLTVREGLATAEDVALLSRSDFAVMRALSDAEAGLAVAALGLHEVREWLSRIPDDMVTLASRGTVLWARLAASPVEQQVTARP